jgi:hypothetical protein
MSSEQEIGEFVKIVALAAKGTGGAAERALQGISASDLLIIANEVGVSFSKSKPSVRTVREGLIGGRRDLVTSLQPGDC